MQMVRNGFFPHAERLHIKDIPKLKRKSPYMWQGHKIELSSQDTHKGLRYFFVCPSCGKRRTELRCYSPTFEDLFFCCKQCDKYDRTPYADRTNLNDNNGTDLIEYHINKEKEKLEDLGLVLTISCEKLRQKTNQALIADGSIGIAYEDEFDYQAHLWQRPKHMKVMPFKRKLVKLKLLYDLWNNAFFDGICYTGKDIRAYTGKDKIDEFIRKSETDKQQAQANE